MTCFRDDVRGEEPRDGSVQTFQSYRRGFPKWSRLHRQYFIAMLRLCTVVRLMETQARLATGVGQWCRGSATAFATVH